MAYQIAVGSDGARRFTFVSSSCEALNGVGAEAVIADGTLLYNQILPDYRARFVEAEEAALRKMIPFTFEAPFDHPHRGVRWHRITSAPRALADGSTLWDGFQIDITDQMRAQRRLELALDATGLGLWEYEIDADRLYWSRRTRELYGLGPDVPIDFDLYSRSIHPEDRDASLQAYRRALEAGGGDFSFEHRTVSPDGRLRWVLAHGRVVAEGGQPRLVIGTSLDITGRKEAEEARALLLGELNHRVKNDFQIVAGLLDMQARRNEDPAVRAVLETIGRRVAGIARAHQNLYAAGAGQAVAMADYLGGICGDLATGLFDQSGVTMRWQVAECSLSRDRAVAIGLIVNELVTNAVKHAFVDRLDGEVEVKLERSDEALILTVADNGVGLPNDFNASKGLGRSLVHAFARQASGALTVAPGPGARFILHMHP